jgi:amino acid transporter
VSTGGASPSADEGGEAAHGLHDKVVRMSSKSTRPAVEEQDDDLGSKSTLWGFLSGIIVAAFIAVPLSASFAFATHPNTQQLFGDRLSEATEGGYRLFWWLVTALFVALPVLVGYSVAKLSGRTLAVVGAIIALLVIAILVVGQLWVF